LKREEDGERGREREEKGVKRRGGVKREGGWRGVVVGEERVCERETEKDRER